MRKESIWLEGIKSKITPKLTKGITTDILIIGGGLAGMSTAFSLRDQNKDIVLIDKYKVGHGASANTTGKLTFLQGLIYQKLEANFGPVITDLYLKSQQEAINIVEQNVINYHIDCNLEGVSSMTFTDQLQDLKKFQKEELILVRNKIAYKIKDRTPLEKVSYAIEVKNTAVFHPLKYILELKRLCLKSGISIYENTRALTLKKTSYGYLVDTEEGYIKAKKVVICTHYPFFTVPGLIPFRTHIERSYLLAGKLSKSKKVSAISSGNPLKTMRYHQDRHPYLLYGAESHKLGTKLDYQNNYDNLIHQSKKYLNHIDYIWQNQDVMTNDSLPLIGKLEKDDDTLLVATGFNTWGMTNGVIAGQLLADLLLGKENKYEKLFAPYRGMSFDKIKNFIITSFETTKTYALSHCKNYFSFYLNEIKITTLNGKKVGIYIDEDGKYHTVSHNCPHLKCGLTFNMFMKTWDCPCHGSRFTIDGTCIEGPSVHDITI